MLSRVERSLGDDGAQADLSAAAQVTQVAGVYRAAVQIRSRAGSGERVLENENCQILGDSVALVIALSASEAPDSQNRGLTLAVSAHATAVTGLLPSIGVGAGGALALEGFASLRIELIGSYYAKQSSTYEDSTIGAEFRLLRFGARGCRLWAAGPFELAPCVGAQLYHLTGRGIGVMKYESGTAYLWGPAVGVFTRLRLFSFLAVVLSADATVPVSRQRFVYRDADLGQLHRPAVLAFQLFIAPEVQF